MCLSSLAIRADWEGVPRDSNRGFFLYEFELGYFKIMRSYKYKNCLAAEKKFLDKLREDDPVFSTPDFPEHFIATNFLS